MSIKKNIDIFLEYRKRPSKYFYNLPECVYIYMTNKSCLFNVELRIHP